MVNLIDWLLDLFRDPAQAAAFVANPDQAMADAGLSSVTSAQLAAVASTAIPSLALSGGGDPVVGLQQAVTSHYGFAPAFVPQPLADTNADLLSDNRILSPTTNISDDHSISFGLGDITLGDKTTAHGDGAVAIGGSNHGDILSGDGAVLGNGNTVNNGSIHAGAGSSVAVGDHNGISAGNTTAGGDVLSSHDGTVIQTSGHGTTSVADGNTTTVHGNQTITDIHGSGNTSGVDNNTNVIHTSTTDNSVHDSSVHSTSVLDSSVHDSSVHDSSIVDTSVHDNSAPSSSVFDSSVHNNALFDSSLHDNSIHETTHQNTGLETHVGF
ncbi:MAG TPA: IniB N-terminal domain-containing protein [Mycobacterium sp.]|jgi:hypothetical protein